ncbi:acid protease [Phlegmacium glaucopus]|nr:acid protease [Phlegmacium glaucopus]
MRSVIPLSLLLTILDSSVNAVILPLEARAGPPPAALRRRGSTSTVQNLTTLGNVQYATNLTIAGVELVISLDTGSSDLWASFPGTVPTASIKDTGKSLTLNYAVGSASGDIQTTSVQIGNITINDQALLLVNDSTTFPGAQTTNGLLGLGFNSASSIFTKLGKSSTGNTLIQHIFEQGNTANNYITFLLGRDGTSPPVQGQFSIGEVIPGFENITSMPKLDVETVSRLLPAGSSQQHWQALTDKDHGIIGPDGQPIQISSIVPKAPHGQYVAVFDSGFTLTQLPRPISDAIYGRVQGAQFDSDNQWWTVPCQQYLNVSVNFGGRNYPIHPLDLVDDNLNLTDSTGKKVCLGAYQPITSAFSIFGTFDMILGMSFLRNAYILLDAGNAVDDSVDQVSPYVQLASVIDPIAAQKDFVNIRLGGNASALSDPRFALLPTNESQHSPIPPGETTKHLEEKVLSRLPYIVLGAVILLALITGCCIWQCCCRGRGKCCRCCGRRARNLPSNNPKVFAAGSGDTSYVPLENRSINEDYSKHPLPAYHQGNYGNGGQGFIGQYKP